MSLVRSVGMLFDFGCLACAGHGTALSAVLLPRRNAVAV